jgi:hypothetical protein
LSNRAVSAPPGQCVAVERRSASSRPIRYCASRRHGAGEATAGAVLPRLRERGLGSGHPVGQPAVEGRRCRLRRKPGDVPPLAMSLHWPPVEWIAIGPVAPASRRPAMKPCSAAVLSWYVPAQLAVSSMSRHRAATESNAATSWYERAARLLAVEVRPGVGQQAVAGPVGRRGATARPVRDVMPPWLPVSMYSDSGGCFGRFCPGVSRAHCSSPLRHPFALPPAGRERPPRPTGPAQHLDSRGGLHAFAEGQPHLAQRRTDRRAGCGLRFLQECVSAGGGREHECGREDRNDLSQYR